MQAGYNHFMVLTSQGEVFVWGDNTYGQLGLNDTTITTVNTLTQITGLSDIIEITVIRNTNFVTGQ